MLYVLYSFDPNAFFWIGIVLVTCLPVVKSLWRTWYLLFVRAPICRTARGSQLHSRNSLAKRWHGAAWRGLVSNCSGCGTIFRCFRILLLTGGSLHPASHFRTARLQAETHKRVSTQVSARKHNIITGRSCVKTNTEPECRAVVGNTRQVVTEWKACRISSTGKKEVHGRPTKQTHVRFVRLGVLVLHGLPLEILVVDLPAVTCPKR